MGKYVHLFINKTEFQQGYENEYEEPWVSYTDSEYQVDYNKDEYRMLLKTPLTYSVTNDGFISWRSTDASTNKTIEYSKNGGEWTSITANPTDGVIIPAVSGDEIQFKGNNPQYATSIYAYNTFSGSTAKFNIKGNIMSLIDGDNFAAINTLPSAITFPYLFSFCTGLTDASKLILPAKTMLDRCYQNMFYGSSGLTNAPELPATTLASYCYYGMFTSCSALTSAPELPALTLVQDGCYSRMFMDCISLNYIKAMFTSPPGALLTSSWVLNVSQTGTFVKNSAAEWTTTGTSSVPNGWTIVLADS